MSKFLIDQSNDEVRSEHQFPMDFSVSGHYVVDVPNFLQVKAQTTSVTDLIAAKITAFKAAHPTLPNDIGDEFIASPNVDQASSAFFTEGPGKRTILFPGAGFIYTDPIAIAGTITTVFPHWHGFRLFSEPATAPASGAPPPDRLLYNFDEGTSAFEDFIPSTFAVEIVDAGSLATLLALSPDVEQAFAFGPGSVRILIANLDPDNAWYLSDWLILHD